MKELIDVAKAFNNPASYVEVEIPVGVSEDMKVEAFGLVITSTNTLGSPRASVGVRRTSDGGMIQFGSEVPFAADAIGRRVSVLPDAEFIHPAGELIYVLGMANFVGTVRLTGSLQPVSPQPRGLEAAGGGGAQATSGSYAVDGTRPVPGFITRYLEERYERGR